MDDLLRPLESELDAWQAAGRCATLWWRDDDAPTSPLALLPLLASARTHRVPCGLAVVPARGGLGELARLVAGEPAIRILQHGYSHLTHSTTSAGHELELDRPLEVIEEELARGRRRLAEAFGASSAPMLVPPGNRIAEPLVARLPALGFSALSTAGPRVAAEPVPGLRQFNVHCDPVDWSGPAFAGPRAVSELVGHLRSRRAGTADPSEPTGLVTHHWAHDRATWEFLHALLGRVRRHPAGRWLDPARLARP